MQSVKEYYIEVNGKIIVLSYCNTCNIRRPPRTFHCSRCNACVEVHDHHCPWVGTCIGKRNHKFFTMFLMYTSLHAAFTASSGLVTIVKGYDFYLPNGDFLTINYPCWIVTIFSLMMLLVLFPFSLYHFYLQCRGRTTNEEVRGKYDLWKGNPFDRGTCLANCRDGFKKHQSNLFALADSADSCFGSTNNRVNGA